MIRGDQIASMTHSDRRLGAKVPWPLWLVLGCRRLGKEGLRHLGPRETRQAVGVWRPWLQIKKPPSIYGEGSGVGCGPLAWGQGKWAVFLR